MNTRKTPNRKDDRVIIHFDYDCFYASVFENEDPSLKSLPLAVQQKQIIVTCNYEARRRGLRKLQLITEARQVCPDVVIVKGEQLDRFRDASKMLYKYLEAFTWNKRVERLGFDEVFMDVTDLVDYNDALLNFNDLENAFFQLSREDPTLGFPFDATSVSGHTYPDCETTRLLPSSDNDLDLLKRLVLGSHLGRHIRHQLEENKGYTCTVGISTSKLLSKLVGNLHKPKAQTTLIPPYEIPGTLQQGREDTGRQLSNVTSFIDAHDIGKIPGIGFKLSQKIRAHVLSRPAEFDKGLVYGGTIESVTVGDVRTYPGMGAEVLEKLLGGPGAERGIGAKVWALINGVDDTEVRPARKVPSQISIEDSYIKLDTMAQVNKELRMLSLTLLNRLHIDLLSDEEDDTTTSKRWIAHPRTIRLTTRPREPLNSDGTRTRNFSRISRSGSLPSFVLDLREGNDAIVEKLVRDTLIPMFKRLHPEPDGWNLSLMNVAVTNMLETASNDGSGGGRDIGRMFRRQEEVLKDFKVVEDKDVSPHIGSDPGSILPPPGVGSHEPSAGNDAKPYTEQPWGYQTHQSQTVTSNAAGWDDEGNNGNRCDVCGAVMPAFAMAAHARYHRLGDS